MMRLGVLAAAGLLAAAVLAGTAFAGGIHPDPPPKPPPPPPPVAPAPPPPPPPVVAPPPPPPAYVAPPPPPAPVVHAKVRKPVHHAKKQSHKKAAAKPIKPLLAAGAPLAATTGSTLPALLIVLFGATLALLAVGVSFVPASAVPFAVGLRLERSRPTIMLVGLAIGAASVLVGLLTVLLGP